MQPLNVKLKGMTNYHQRCYGVFDPKLKMKLKNDEITQLALGSEIGASETGGLISFLKDLKTNTSLQSIIVQNPMANHESLKLLLMALQVKEAAKDKMEENSEDFVPGQTLVKKLERINFETACFSTQRSSEKTSTLFDEFQKTCDNLPHLRELFFTSCKLDTRGCETIARVVNVINNLDILDLSNGQNGCNFENVCNSEGVQNILAQLRSKDMVHLSLPGPETLTISALNEIKDFLTHSPVRKLHLGRVLSKDTIYALQDALAGTETDDPNFTLTHILKTETNIDELKPYLERNRLFTSATDSLNALLKRNKTTKPSHLDKLSSEDWKKIRQIIILIDKAIATGHDSYGAIHQQLAKRFPILPHIYLRMGRLGAAYDCIVNNDNEVYKMGMISEILMKNEFYPFFDSDQKRTFAICMLMIYSLKNKSDNWNEENLGTFITDSFGLSGKRRDSFLSLLRKQNYKLDDEGLQQTTVGWLLNDLIKNVTPNILEQTLNEETLNKDSSFGEMYDWVIKNLSKEMTFSRLLGQCQDHRYGDSTIDESVNILTQSLLEHILKRRYKHPLEQLWVLDHLLWVSLNSEKSHTRKNKLYMFNINGFGLECRKDKVKLSETQRNQYKLLKNLGLKIIEDISKDEGLTDGEKKFTKEQIRYFNLNLAHYEIFMKEITNSQKKADILLSVAPAV